MSIPRSTSLRGRSLLLALFAVLVLLIYRALLNEPEIALTIGEPWESMRQQSSAAIGPVVPGYSWYNIPKSDARLIFTDPQYKFTTPLARFFTVSFDSKGLVRSVRMSPQVEPLLLEDTLEVLLDLQEQWRRSGWASIRPPIEDTPEWRARLRDVNKGGTTFWQAGDLYQAMLVVGRFRDDNRPKEERYLITLSIAEPWVRP